MSAHHCLPRLCLALFLLATATSAFSKVWTVPASANLEYDAQEALLSAAPGDTVILPRGRFQMSGELSMTLPHLTLKGAGIDQTILEYGENASGPQAIIAMADYSTVEDLTILNHPGDGIKAISVKGPSIRRTKVEWTKRGDTQNGAYGLYPVLSTDVLLEDNIVIGASDSGIYVGQSNNIVVRRNRVEYNVAGIEIENSQHADVYENYATNNTGGILVFNLPNLLVQGGRGTRVYKNTLVGNNYKNFAAEGNSVALVPQGTGILVLANDDIEIFGNTIEKHNTTSIAIVSYHITERLVEDPAFDAIPENIFIHDNVMRSAGRWPLIGGNQLGIVAGALSFPHRIPHITYDGIGLSDGKEGFVGADLKGDRRICIGTNDHDGGEKSYFGNMQLWTKKWYLPIPGFMDRSLEPHSCVSKRLATVQLAEVPALPPLDPNLPTPEETAALCEAGSEGVNWEAARVDCAMLSQYNLFNVPSDALSGPQEGGYPYDLTSPLFSDFASKSRLLFLPPGSHADYRKYSIFDLPVGSIIAKTFYFPADMRHPDGLRRVVETRLLIHRESGWVGLNYLWKGGDAKLIKGGALTPVTWMNEKGNLISNNYRVPNLAQCTGCHAKNEPIGVKAGYLNREGAGSLAGHNQLQYLADQGRLEGLPTAAEEIPRFPVWNRPETGSLADRAKTYLDINCAHCHNLLGKANSSGLFLNIGQAQNIQFGICKPPIAAGRGAGGTLFDIVPGKPEESILVHRMDSTKAAIKMPELSKTMVHTEGVDLIKAWIKSLPGSCPE